jgi:hypothetical protein
MRLNPEPTPTIADSGGASTFGNRRNGLLFPKVCLSL